MLKHILKTTAIIIGTLSLSQQTLANDRSYILATASTGGTYYPVGVALATLSKVKLAPKQHFSLAAISSAGSGENIKLLNDNQAQFAILQGLYGAWACKAKDLMKVREAKLSCVRFPCYGKTLNILSFGPILPQQAQWQIWKS